MSTNIDEAKALAHQVHLELAKNNDMEALWQLGIDYERGDGTEKSGDKAFECYQKSASQGFVKAMLNMGICYIKGRYVKQNIKRGIEYLETAANEGYGVAQFEVANLYLNSPYVESDLKKSMYWMKLAAENGIAEACYLLGISYLSGGCPALEQNTELAEKYLLKASKKKNDDAQYALFLLYSNVLEGIDFQPKPEEAMKLLYLSALHGNPTANYDLALKLFDGDGILEDKEAACLIYHDLAEKNYVAAQASLASCYLSGCGVEENREKAIFWFTKAADHVPDPIAISSMEVLAFLYWNSDNNRAKELVEQLAKLKGVPSTQVLEDIQKIIDTENNNKKGAVAKQPE